MTPATHVATAIAPEVKVPSTPSLDNQFQAALEHARRLTNMYGTNRIEVALAWETVEELRTAILAKKVTQKTPFERYCEAYPEAPECRIYED